MTFFCINEEMKVGEFMIQSVTYRKTHTCPCHSIVLMRMMLSGSRSSEMRIWFSWSYTDFLGTFVANKNQSLRSTRATAEVKTCIKGHICEFFTCAMSRESGEHSLSMLLVLSLWALEFCLSFMDVLRGRLCSLFSILLWKGHEKLKTHDGT